MMAHTIAYLRGPVGGRGGLHLALARANPLRTSGRYVRTGMRVSGLPALMRLAYAQPLQAKCSHGAPGT